MDILQYLVLCQITPICHSQLHLKHKEMKKDETEWKPGQLRKEGLQDQVLAMSGPASHGGK